MNAIWVTIDFWISAMALVSIAAAIIWIPLAGLRGAARQPDPGAGAEDAASHPVSASAPSAASRPARRLAAATALVMPLGVLGGYLSLGNPDLMVRSALAQAEALHAEENILESIRVQTAHLAEHPEDALAWVTLGLTYKGMERWPDAEKAFAEAYALEPKDAFVVSAYAEAMAVNAGRDLSGRPIALIREALLMAPQDEKALELAALHAFQEQEYGKSAYYFRQLLKVLPPESPYAADIESAMREARRLSELSAFGAPMDASESDPAR